MLSNFLLALTLAIQDPTSPAGGGDQQAATPTTSIQPAASPVTSQAQTQSVPSVKIDAEIRGNSGEPFDVSFTYTGDAVEWKFVGDDITAKRLHELAANKVTFSVFSKSPARAWLVVVSAAKDGTLSKQESGKITVGEPQPTPVVDTLSETLTALYIADASPTKQADALALASVYRVGAKSTVDAPELKTNGDLSRVLGKAASDLVPLPKLESVRKAIQAEVILKQFPDPAAALTLAGRAAWRVQLLRVAGALESIAK